MRRVGYLSTVLAAALLTGSAVSAVKPLPSFYQTFSDKCIAPIVGLESRSRSETQFDRFYMLRWIGKNSSGSEVCLATLREDYLLPDDERATEISQRKAVIETDLAGLPAFHSEMEQDGWTFCWDKTDDATSIMYVKGERPGPRFGFFAYFHPEFSTAVLTAIRSETADNSLDDCTGGAS